MAGHYEYGKLNPVLIDSLMLVAAGRVQQVIVAALQILYDVGRRTKKGPDYAVNFQMKKQTTDITVYFKFNGQPVHLAIKENSILQHTSYMSLYIED